MSWLDGVEADFGLNFFAMMAIVLVAGIIGFPIAIALAWFFDVQAAEPDAGRDLFEAMSGIAATGRGPAEQIPGIGCSIKWRDPDAPE